MNFKEFMVYFRGIWSLVKYHDLTGSDSSNDGNLSPEELYEARGKNQNKTQHN